MANETMTLISTTTVGAGGAASIDFTSIPQTGTDLLLVFSARVADSSVATGGQITFNGSASGYSERLLYGNSVSALSANRSGNFFTWAATLPGSLVTASTHGSTQVYIPNYTGSSAKGISAESISENNASGPNDANIYAVAGLWSGTSAVTSLRLYHASNFVQYSTASLYTITKGSGGATVS